MRRLAAAAVLAGIAACSLTTNLDGLSGGLHDAGPAADSPTGPGSEADAMTPVPGIDGGGDATLAPPSTGGGVVIATNTSLFAAGAAQKHHVHYAQNLAASVVFYESAAERDRIHVKVTTDFVTFVDAPPIMLPRPHDGDGRNFEVTYQNIGGADIFYVAFSTHDTNRYSYVIRGRVQGGTFTWSAPVGMGEADKSFDNVDPDAPAILLLANGEVLFSSGFNFVDSHFYNFCGFQSTAVDDGSAGFSVQFADGKEVEVAANSVNARLLLPLPGGGAAGLWERGDFEPMPKDLAYSIWLNGVWSSAGTSGLTLASYDQNDWDGVSTKDGRMHLVRWTDNAYEHRYYANGNGTVGFVVPSSPHSAGDGLVLLDLGGTATMFEIDTDRVIRRTKLVADTWVPWDMLVPADVARRHLAGAGNGENGVLLWEVVHPDGSSDLAGMKLP